MPVPLPGVNAGTLLILAYSCLKTYIEASMQKGVDMSDPLMEAVYRANFIIHG